jgi:hypothetical protein
VKPIEKYILNFHEDKENELIFQIIINHFFVQLLKIGKSIFSERIISRNYVFYKKLHYGEGRISPEPVGVVGVSISVGILISILVSEG